MHFFNGTIINIFKNYIPSKVLTINDCDPPWLTDQIKRKINLKNIKYHTYVRNGKNNMTMRTSVLYAKMSPYQLGMQRKITTIV